MPPVTCPQVWQLGSSSPNFTLEGHEKGVNCIDYYSGGDKPYLISGADDRLVKIWDYQVGDNPRPVPLGSESGTRRNPMMSMMFPLMLLYLFNNP